MYDESSEMITTWVNKDLSKAAVSRGEGARPKWNMEQGEPAADEGRETQTRVRH